MPFSEVKGITPQRIDNTIINDISKVIKINNSSQYQLIDSVRNFVYSNSVHGEARGFTDTRCIEQSLWSYYKTKENAPRLTCGPRAKIMKLILDHFHIKSRIVHIYNDTNDQIRSHTFLEVYNKDSNNWEIQDPDYNIVYLDKITSKRVATADIIFGDNKTIIPCSSISQGWDSIGISYLKEYFKAVEYDSVFCGVTSIILINNSLLNTNKRYHKNNDMTFIEYLKKTCVNPIIISNHPQLCKLLLALLSILPNISSY